MSAAGSQLLVKNYKKLKKKKKSENGKCCYCARNPNPVDQ